MTEFKCLILYQLDCKIWALGTPNWKFSSEVSKLCLYRKSYKAGYLNTDTIGILVWVILCCGRQCCTLYGV